MAYAATIAGSGITSANDATIFIYDGSDNPTLIARSGTANAPGTTAMFSAFSDPVINNNKAVAFRATLKVATGQATSSTASGIWATVANATNLTLVAQQGTQAPGCPVGATFASFTELALPDVGGRSVYGYP